MRERKREKGRKKTKANKKKIVEGIAKGKGKKKEKKQTRRTKAIMSRPFRTGYKRTSHVEYKAAIFAISFPLTISK